MGTVVLMRVALSVTLLAGGCSADASPPESDAGLDESRFACGDRACAVDLEACVWRPLTAPSCEPQIAPELAGIERCRAHVDAYCGGRGERCEEGGEGDLPLGAYRVLCL